VFQNNSSCCFITFLFPEIAISIKEYVSFFIVTDYGIRCVVLDDSVSLPYYYYCTEKFALMRDFLFMFYIYIFLGFKTSGDAFRLPHSIAFDCSIRPF
jgi:hypothetical protein